MHRTLISFTAVLSAVVPLLMPGIANADNTFTGASGSGLSWFNPKNWDSGQIPTSDDNAVILVPKQTEANPVVIDNAADPSIKVKIAVAARLVVGDGAYAKLTIKSDTNVFDSFRVGTSDFNHTGNGTVIQMGGKVDPGTTLIGKTSGLTGTYCLQGGTFAVGDTNLFIGGDTDPGQPSGVGSFIINGGTLTVGSRVVFGKGGNASFTIIGSQATPIQIGDQFNEDSAGLVNLNVQVDKGGLTPINTDILGLQGITLFPSFAKGVTPYAGTWTVITFNSLTGNSDSPVLGKGVDETHWSAHLGMLNKQLTVTYKP